ncbi:vanadium-dependent haloperoxidase [Mesorhizobium sp. M0187]|uniref:vanadium-dependent haloperoxidase n=1 Tax=Mesorhizobium sp. M0187 TaxID=2956908 RepID=UPI003339762E
MKRRDLLKLAGAAPIAMVGSAGSALSQESSDAEPSYPLSDKIREEFERLLSLQEGKANVLGFRELPRIAEGPVDRYLMWSLLAHDASALDHVPTSKDIPEAPQRFGFQLGPHRSSRAMAIVHIAMFEAINAVTKKRKSYIGLPPAAGDVSIQAAVAWAAHDALVALYPYQQQRISALLSSDLIRIPEINDPTDIAKSDALAKASMTLGKAAASTIVTMRANDGSNHVEPAVGVDHPLVGGAGHWDIDPISKLSVALGARWGSVRPFILTSGDQFRPAAPPALDSPEYAAAYSEVKRVGGDPRNNTPTERMDFETFEGVFWAFDGTPGLCAPPRLYNKIAQDVALQKRVTELEEVARILAIVNVAMADAGIAAWDAKWHYDFWRPVTGIRWPDDGNPQTDPDPAFYPLGAPATNGRGPNFTPPFPAYPSGHAVFGGAVFQALRALIPADGDESFTFVSDEYNGQNRGIYDKKPRPRLPQSFVSYSHPEYLNARSRIFLGIHWHFDASVGIEVGNKVADHVLANLYT